jgi:hypothetical protein
LFHDCAASAKFRKRHASGAAFESIAYLKTASGAATIA